MNLKCIVCCSDDTVKITGFHPMRIPFGRTVRVKCKVEHCNGCGREVEIDFANDLEAFKNTQEYKTALADSLANIVKKLKDCGYSISRVERAFNFEEDELDSLLRYENVVSDDPKKEIPADVLSLMRILGTFPYLVSCAENNFSDESRKQALQNVFTLISV